MLSKLLTNSIFCWRSPFRTALLSLFLIFCLFSPGHTQDYDKIGVLSGLTVNNYQLLGRMMIVFKISDKFHVAPGTDFSRQEEAYHTRFIYSPWSWNDIQLHFILGPQVEAVNTNPSQDDEIYYLMNSTGFLITYEFRPGLNFVTGVDWLTPNKDVAPWKVGAGIVAWF